MRKLLMGSFWVGLLVVAGGCASAPYDYGPYLDHMPRSILVLPPLNESPEVDAPYSFLSTVTRPLAERGYYVFPVAVVDHLLKENGLPTPGEMNQIPLARIRDVVGADAVLYSKVKHWGTSYRILDSRTTVTVESHLVDVETGQVIWAAQQTMVDSSASAGGGDPIIMLVTLVTSAIIHQVVGALGDPSHDLSEDVNERLFWNSQHGLLLGAHHPEFTEDQRRRREERVAR